MEENEEFSIAELQQQLKEHSKELVEVESLYQESGGDEDLKSLLGDLQDLVALTYDQLQKRMRMEKKSKDRAKSSTTLPEEEHELPEDSDADDCGEGDNSHEEDDEDEIDMFGEAKKPSKRRKKIRTINVVEAPQPESIRKAPKFVLQWSFVKGETLTHDTMHRIVESSDSDEELVSPQEGGGTVEDSENDDSEEHTLYDPFASDDESDVPHRSNGHKFDEIQHLGERPPDWETHTKGLGSRLMMQMGWRPGFGLSATGRSEPIIPSKVDVKRCGQGLGFSVAATESLEDRNGKSSGKPKKRGRRGGTKERRKRQRQESEAEKRSEKNDMFGFINKTTGGAVADQHEKKTPAPVKPSKAAYSMASLDLQVEEKRLRERADVLQRQLNRLKQKQRDGCDGATFKIMQAASDELDTINSRLHSVQHASSGVNRKLKWAKEKKAVLKF